ncbi:TetR/AcrR family transcriptional regulator [Metapseudomonas resinovorans]|uniref:Putative TetR family transcriptional regulator n=1 Tax=Metapseudomonas resinovorans NBRC 106553 TaxID=1245471 RepID=S6AU62_METRE|nr:TetR family transcriptional regulator [Pseudomonas resinovorans]BAN47816.1 putative TetR family transcriptional regulator [Pseudomonas resinovorans NBRC 106553]
MASSKREQLVSTALALFYRDGFHATGIDRILAESGVAKMTLYNHFKSKDELIIAALESRFAPAAERMARAFAELPPRDAILRVFDGLDEWLRQDEFCGCAFINAAAEFHRRDHPVHQLAASYKAATQDYFRGALERLGVVQPERLARQLQYLMEGAVSMAHIEGPADQALDARDAAEQLLRAAGV